VATGIGRGCTAHPGERVVDARAVIGQRLRARNACGRRLVGPAAARVDDRRQVERDCVVQIFPPRHTRARVAACLRDDADGSVAAVFDREGTRCPALFAERPRRIGGGQVSGARRACVRAIVVERSGAGERCSGLGAAACGKEQEPGAGAQRIDKSHPLWNITDRRRTHVAISGLRRYPTTGNRTVPRDAGRARF
jgi:hypothetical protein